MTQATLHGNDTAVTAVLYMALELSKARWKVGFEHNGRRRRVSVEGGNLAELAEALGEARAKFKLPETVAVRSCYEAGRDGFWLHRWLASVGVMNLVVDPASIEVNRRARRVKTDTVDLEMLLTKLIAHHRGERVWKMVRVPDPEVEAARHLHRERERLQAEHTRETNRLKGLLFAQGIRLKSFRLTDWATRVEGFRLHDGQALPGDLKADLKRAGERLGLLDQQLKAIEAEQARRLREAPAEGALAKVRQLCALKGLGPTGSWVLVMEFFGWRAFQNGKEVGAAAGLTATPYASGASAREQGISKAGNRRVRALMVELAWLWLRYQGDSALSRWFHERFGANGKRHRRIGIVALARKLLVALWRYLETGEPPAGAKLKMA